MSSFVHRCVALIVTDGLALIVSLEGSGRIGRVVATAAAKHLTPVSLEVSLSLIADRFVRKLTFLDSWAVSLLPRN